MKFGVPWRAKGIRPEARETAKEAARRSGMSLDDWLNSVILQQAAQAGVPPYGPQPPPRSRTGARSPPSITGSTICPAVSNSSPAPDRRPMRRSGRRNRAGRTSAPS